MPFCSQYYATVTIVSEHFLALLGDISICHTWNLSLWNYLLLFLAMKMVGMGGGRTSWVRNEPCIYGHVLFPKGRSCSCFCKPVSGGKMWNSVHTTACTIGHISCSNTEMHIWNARNPFTGKLTPKEQQQQKKAYTKKIPHCFHSSGCLNMSL